MSERSDIPDPVDHPDLLDPVGIAVADNLAAAVGFTHNAAITAAGLSTADGSTVAFLGDLAHEVFRNVGAVVEALTARLNALADGRP